MQADGARLTNHVRALSTLDQCRGQVEYRRRRRHRGWRASGPHGLGSHVVRDRRACQHCAAGAVRSSSPRSRLACRLPLLPRDRRACSERRTAADDRLRRLPHAGARRERSLRARARKPPVRSPDPLATRERAPRFRLLRSLDPRREGYRLRILSWTRRSHGANGASDAALDGMVPRVPPRPRSPPPTPRGDHHDGLGLDARGGGGRHNAPAPRASVPRAIAYRLFHLPSVRS